MPFLTLKRAECTRTQGGNTDVRGLNVTHHRIIQFNIVQRSPPLRSFRNNKISSNTFRVNYFFVCTDSNVWIYYTRHSPSFVPTDPTRHTHSHDSCVRVQCLGILTEIPGGRVNMGFAYRLINNNNNYRSTRRGDNHIIISACAAHLDPIYGRRRIVYPKMYLILKKNWLNGSIRILEG